MLENANQSAINHIGIRIKVSENVNTPEKANVQSTVIPKVAGIKN